MIRRQPRLLSFFSLLVILSMLAAACAGAAPSAPAAPAQEAAATEAPTEAPTEAAAAPAGEEKLGASLIGTIEGPDIITDASQYPSEFHQAPMLDALVKDGKLPAVADRLPQREDLLVIKPLKEIGKYGGTWHRGFTGPADGSPRWMARAFAMSAW